MSDRSNPVSRRARTGVGLAFVALAMVVTSVLAGLGFASSAPSAAQYQYGKKIAICHYTGSKKHPWVTLHVDIHSWPGHLEHGDSSAVLWPACSFKKQQGKIAICHYTGSKKHPMGHPARRYPLLAGASAARRFARSVPAASAAAACSPRKPKPKPKPANHGHGSKGDQGSTGGHGHRK